MMWNTRSVGLRGGARRVWATTAVVGAVALTSAPAASAPAAGSETLIPGPDLDLPALERVVRGEARGVQAAALDVALANAEVTQSQLRPNPVLDLSWGTIPVGQTNPPNLPAPLAHVPNYGVGVSYTFELGKRSPRIAMARANEVAARHLLEASVRQQALALAELLGQLATSSLKLEGLHGVLEGGERQLRLAEERVRAGFASPLDVDRLRIDVSRTAAAVRAEESAQLSSLGACAGFAGRVCEPFPGPVQARAFLTNWVSGLQARLAQPAPRVEVLALAALTQASRAEAELANAQRVPDPTVRLGYVRDQFEAAGAQGNSINLAVSLPLPVFERGQAQRQAAVARSSSYARQRATLLREHALRLPLVQQRLSRDIARQHTISEDVMPRALAVLHDVERAAELRLVVVSDVIQARRAFSELLVEEASAYGQAFDTSLELAAASSDPGAPGLTRSTEIPR